METMELVLEIGARVENENGDTGTVTSIDKGWVAVELDDGETKKFRAKQLTVTEANCEEADEEAEGEEAEGEEAEGEEAEGEEGANGSTFRGERLRERKAQYVKQRHCGDTVAYALAQATLPAILRLTRGLDLYNPKWESLNAGQQRMNAGNRIRAHIRKEEKAGNTDTVAAIMQSLADIEKKPQEFRVLRNGRPVKRCATNEEAMTWMNAAADKADANTKWGVEAV